MKMTANDLDLLRKFTQERSEDAFAVLVQRHLDLVYCAALRQVRSPQLAEEVAQSVFSDLARSAANLRRDTVLTAWLYEVTRRTAINVVRGEARRQLREQVATEINAMNADSAVWTQVEPLLDEAMHALNQVDRTAVLLRYFENKSLRDVGEALGVSDDAAQKRVSRALERLREFFSKRGVTASASGLVVVISANAVQAAPGGLAIAISTAAAISVTTIATATKAITLSALQKTATGLSLAAVIGTGIYHYRQASALRVQIQALQKQQTPLTKQIQAFRSDHDELTNRLVLLADENQRLRSNGNELLRLRAEVARVRGENQLLMHQLSGLNERLSTAPTQPANELGCRANLKRIGAAKAVYALENRQVVGAEVAVENVLRYLGVNELPKCPLGGTYTLERVGDDPSCSIEGHSYVIDADGTRSLRAATFQVGLFRPPH